MADSELDHPDGSSFPGDPRLLLAATVVVVGSAAYLWRANLAQVSSSYLGRVAGASVGQGVRGCAADGDAGFRALAETASKPEGAGSVPDDKGAKGARSKERRRRGKDPLKDLVKGGKKLKGLALSIPGDPADARSASTPPHLHEPPSSSHSIRPSAGPSPRRNGRLADAQAYIDSRPDGVTDDEDAMCSSVSGLSSCPTEASSSRAEASSSRVRASSRAREDDASTATPSSNTHEDRIPHDDHDPVSISSSASHSSTASLSSFSDSADTVDTSTTSVSEYVSTPKAGADRPSSGVFDESNDTVFDRSSSSTGAGVASSSGAASSSSTGDRSSSTDAAGSSSKAASSTAKLQFPGPWDPDPDDARDPRKSSPSKPSRKRSRSRGPLDPSSPSRSSRPSGSRHGSEAPAHSSAAAHGRPLDGSRGAEHAVTPTTPGPASGLPTPGASSASTSYSAPTSQLGPPTATTPGAASGPYASTTSGPHPASTPGPYSEPSVCLQTQVASLRGALEASRKREENMRGEMERQGKEMEQRSREMESRTREWERQRGEMERQSKDVEMLRWESAHWRRREMELQTQIHHLMQQLQYSTMMASNSARMRGSGSNGSNSPAPSTGPTSPAFSGPPPMSMFSPPMMPSMPSAGMMPSPNGMVPSPSGMIPSPSGMVPSTSGPFSPVLPPHMQQAPPMSMMSPTMQGSPRSPYSYMPEQGRPYSPSQMRPYSPSQMRPYSPYSSTTSIPQSQSHSELLAVFPSSAPRAGGSSGPPSVGSSSRGSASPELAASGSTASSSHNLTTSLSLNSTGSSSQLSLGSSSQSSLGMDRGRQRTRPGYDGEYDEGAADEYCGVLADAILKRPQAMRVGSRQAKGASRDGEPALTVGEQGASREGAQGSSREGALESSREADALDAADRRETVDLRESPEEEIVEFSFPSISDYREPPLQRDEAGPDEVAA
ncbi:hypothetical protein EV714DRAFT_236477 [Schizophyllum commune]